jgi:hypothetical protein
LLDNLSIIAGYTPYPIGKTKLLLVGYGAGTGTGIGTGIGSFLTTTGAGSSFTIVFGF